MLLKSINKEQGLYVLQHPTCISCIGFAVSERLRVGFCAWAGMDCPEIEAGTPEHFASYSAALAAAQAKSERLREQGARAWQCSIDLTPRLIGLEGRRVKVTSPDGDSESFTVGRSSGWAPCHIALKSSNASGGCAVYCPEGASLQILN